MEWTQGLTPSHTKPRAETCGSSTFLWEFQGFGLGKDLPGLREQNGVTLTQLFLRPCVHFACLFPVQAVLRELCYAAGSVFINQLGAELRITGFIWFVGCDSYLSFLAWRTQSFLFPGWKQHRELLERVFPSRLQEYLNTAISTFPL